MKMTRYIAGIFLGMSLSVTANAQDFYSASLGPKAFQIDTYINYSDKNTVGTVIPKFFAKNLDKSLPDIVVAVPFKISEENGLENAGANLGYHIKGNIGEVISAIGLFKDGSGKYDVINPQLYFTSEIKKLTVDLECSFPHNLNTGNTGNFASATIGYGIYDRVRVGGSVIHENKKNLEYRANIRLELEKNHKYWIQTYIGTKDFGLRFVSNF